MNRQHQGTERPLAPLASVGLAAAFAALVAVGVLLYLPKRAKPHQEKEQARLDPFPGGIERREPTPDPEPEETLPPEKEPERAKLDAPAKKPLPGAPRMAHLVPAEWPELEFVSPSPLLVAARPERVAYQRMTDDTEDDLRRELEGVRELSLYTHATAADLSAANEANLMPIRQTRPDLAGLPLLMGDWCKIHPTAAKTLQDGSTAIRTMMREAGRGAAPDERVLSTSLEKGISGKAEWLRPDAIPALQQMLGGEETPARGLMIGQLSRIEGRWATMALAQRALVEPSPALREQAVKELANRDPKEYVPLLLSALSYPWPAVARHSAEALGALRRTEAVPGLLRLLDGPSPEKPYHKPGKGLHVREMVKINHMRNCMLCHAVSESPADPVRGLVPPTDREMPPAYYSGSGRFIRADTTYFRQDFSLPMTVKNPGIWSPRQRFDFLTRERKAKPSEAKETPGLTTPHQKAILFAITSLTGKDHGPKVEEWRKLYLGKEPEPRPMERITSGISLAIVKGKAITLEGGLTRLSPDGTLGIANGRVVRVGEKLAPLGRTFDAPRRVVPDGKGGAYLTEARVGDTKGALWHLDAEGKATKLPQPFSDPCALALSSDGRLYIAGERGHDLWAFAVVAPGKLAEPTKVTRAGATGPARITDLAVDREGNVAVFDAEASTLTLLNPAGARLLVSKLAEPPVAGAVEGKTAYAVGRGGVLTVPLEIEPLRGLASR